MVCPAALFQTNSLAALAGSNAASRTSQQLSRHGSDRHKKPGFAWRRWRRVTVRAECCPNLHVPAYRSAKGTIRYVLIWPARQKPCQASPFLYQRYTVLYARLWCHKARLFLMFPFTSPWCHSELSRCCDAPVPYPHATQAEPPVTSGADTLGRRAVRVASTALWLLWYVCGHFRCLAAMGDLVVSWDSGSRSSHETRAFTCQATECYRAQSARSHQNRYGSKPYLVCTGSYYYTARTRTRNPCQHTSTHAGTHTNLHTCLGLCVEEDQPAPHSQHGGTR